MKLYNITIKNDDKKGKSLQVKVESYKEFLKWLELLYVFERNEKISHIKVKNYKEVF